MSPDDDEDKPSSVVQLREADRFPELQIDFTDVASEQIVETTVAPETTTVVEFLPVVVTPSEALDPGGPPDLGPATEDAFVPYDVEQQLIYYWLVNGPPWRADLVEQPPPVDPGLPPDVVVNPLHFRRPRPIGQGVDDGMRRMIRVRR